MNRNVAACVVKTHSLIGSHRQNQRAWVALRKFSNASFRNSRTWHKYLAIVTIRSFPPSTYGPWDYRYTSLAIWTQHISLACLACTDSDSILSLYLQDLSRNPKHLFHSSDHQEVLFLIFLLASSLSPDTWGRRDFSAAWCHYHTPKNWVSFCNSILYYSCWSWP